VVHLEGTFGYHAQGRHRLRSSALIDVTLNDFRDMIDYIYYFCETSGSATDGLAGESHWGKQVLSHDGGKAR
jgi:hypothetical protein